MPDGPARSDVADAQGHRHPLTTRGAYAGSRDYIHSEEIAGSKSLGVWPLAQAAQACFGTSEWPAGQLVPRAGIEFEVHDAEAVAAAAEELQAARHELIGISYPPALRDVS